MKMLLPGINFFPGALGVAASTAQSPHVYLSRVLVHVLPLQVSKLTQRLALSTVVAGLHVKHNRFESFLQV